MNCALKFWELPLVLKFWELLDLGYSSCKWHVFLSFENCLIWELPLILSFSILLEYNFNLLLDVYHMVVSNWHDTVATSGLTYFLE
jgi:hypothetical protein